MKPKESIRKSRGFATANNDSEGRGLVGAGDVHSLRRGMIVARHCGRMNRSIPRILLSFLLLSSLAGAAPALRVSGGITLNGAAQPLLFTWNTPLPVAGEGWAPNEVVQIVLHGPLDSPGVQAGASASGGRMGARAVAKAVPVGFGRGHFDHLSRRVADLSLGAFTADARGNLSA